jgi:hypothetical protein
MHDLVVFGDASSSSKGVRMTQSLFTLFLIIVLISACSQSEFSAGSSQRAKDKTKPTQIVTVKTHGSILFVSDLHAWHHSEGEPGVCKQQILESGRKLIDATIVPLLKRKSDGRFIEISLSSNSDVLLDVGALTCDKSQFSWMSYSSPVVVCRLSNQNILGSSGVDQYFGTAKVCGDEYPNQTSLAPSEQNRALLSGVDLAGSHHLYILSYKLGSAMPADKFVSVLRGKLGAALKVSVIYPKNPTDCVSRGINPSSTDTIWRALPASASGPSNVFEEIASSTGGSTHDLCNPAGLEKL